jgi:hypothetical protein
MPSTQSFYKTFDSTLVFEYLVELLWGLALTSLYGIVEPTEGRAVGIVVLTCLLFGGFGPR